MLDDRRGKRPPGDLKVEFALRNRHRKIRSPVEQCRDLVDEIAVEFVYRNVFNPMNMRTRKLGQQSSRISMRVNGGASGEFVTAVQPFCVRHANLDPGCYPSGKVPAQDGGLVSGRDALGQHDSACKFEAVRKHAHEHVFKRLGRMPRNTQAELFINATVDVGKVDIQVVDRRCLCHGETSIEKRIQERPTYTVERE
jgi:hypothetical protein